MDPALQSEINYRPYPPVSHSTAVESGPGQWVWYAGEQSASVRGVVGRSESTTCSPHNRGRPENPSPPPDLQLLQTTVALRPGTSPVVSGQARLDIRSATSNAARRAKPNRRCRGGGGTGRGRGHMAVPTPANISGCGQVGHRVAVIIRGRDGTQIQPNNPLSRDVSSKSIHGCRELTSPTITQSWADTSAYQPEHYLLRLSIEPKPSSRRSLTWDAVTHGDSWRVS